MKKNILLVLIILSFLITAVCVLWIAGYSILEEIRSPYKVNNLQIMFTMWKQFVIGIISFSMGAFLVSKV